MKIKNGTKKEKIITVIGANYISYNLVLDLLSKAFEVYKKRDFRRKDFQVSIAENMYATAGIILTVLGIEAYRNRIFYIEKQKVNKNVVLDLIKIFRNKAPNFPDNSFQHIMSEVFLIRDVIVHNHIYEVEVFYDENWKELEHNQKILEGYGDNKRFRGYVDQNTGQTRLLKFNVQPAKIGFEDLCTLLIIFDLFVGISQAICGRVYVPFPFSCNLNGRYETILSKVLVYYYDQIGNQKYKNQFDSIIKTLSKNYSIFLSNASTERCAITNLCPKCSSFGFFKPNDINKCNKCELEIKI
jgi:hypothetical protein